MNADEPRRMRAGDPLEDLCRPCKAVRGHTVIVADADGRALRVICDYCGSQHNYRGGETRPGASKVLPETQTRLPIQLVTEQERSYRVTMVSTKDGGEVDLEMLLRRVIREETGLTVAPMADKWHGGELVLRPGRPGLQEKSLPIDTFFHKVLLLRNRLRVLEQQINGADIPQELKIKLQAYITGCYGTLTSFNILFAEEEDRFRGASGSD